MRAAVRKGQFRRVHRVRLASLRGSARHDGKADERPPLDRLLNPLSTSRNELTRDGAAHDVVDKLVAAS